ncbi:hypothetical protein KEM54_003484, partial [Ascosphaera aggregata]
MSATALPPNTPRGPRNPPSTGAASGHSTPLTYHHHHQHHQQQQQQASHTSSSSSSRPASAVT